MNFIAIVVMHLVSLAVLMAKSHSDPLSDAILEEWESFKMKYGKKYSNKTEEKFRLKVFLDNWRKITKHNDRYERGEVTFKMGMNKYGDLLRQEAAGSRGGAAREPVRAASYIGPANVALPRAVDWRQLGAVTPVADQGPCSSCWAFSATGALEGQMFRKTGKLVPLSEQNLVDCSRRHGNHGCSGGSMNLAFLYVSENRGLDTDQAYPYTGQEGPCRYRREGAGASAAGYVVLRSGSEGQLLEAVATAGPVSVYLAAAHESFRFYRQGVYFEPRCLNNNTVLHHAALVVGYGTDRDGRDYWILKNSWGTSWGQQGYMHLARDGTNHCGVATAASYPLV
ncbi:procathepsin L-like isoform X4 [Bacillus rossius redtenbacheri]|uniref:procathepsin L-like isoform X4 n=1 Tax=Bacillus rossius redtenbacheri TaxID=93214 RepID=UPI002FDC863E